VAKHWYIKIKEKFYERHKGPINIYRGPKCPRLILPLRVEASPVGLSVNKYNYVGGLRAYLA
jgi:hypothetical protein